MNFVAGFLKLAGEPIAFGAIGKSLASGLRESGSHTIKDTMKLKGLSHLKDAVTSAGGIKKSMTTQAGREGFAKGLGKAAPSIGAAGIYAAGAKKVYDKATEQQQPQYY